jgi:hypothetical protein
MPITGLGTGGYGHDKAVGYGGYPVSLPNPDKEGGRGAQTA